MSFQNSIPSYMSESWTHVYPIYTFQVAEHLQPLGFSGSTIFTINNNLNNQFMPNYYSLPTNQGLMAKDEEWIDRHDEKISQDIKIKEKQVKQAQLKKQKHQKIQKVGRQTQKVQILTCQCKKSFCLKQYCFCFKNGKGCNQKCVCLSCRNTENGLNQKRNSKKSKQVACNCKRTQCSKKYCQCYAAGKGCGDNCKCLQCKN